MIYKLTKVKLTTQSKYIIFIQNIYNKEKSKIY